MFSTKNYGLPKDLIEAAKRVHEKQLFAIFLEENFYVEMLTEENLDYVFENEFPQWLEEVSGNTGIRSKVHKADTGKGGDISTGKYQAQSALEKSIKSGTLATKGSRQTNIISKTKQDVTTGAVKGDTMGGETSAPKPVAPKLVVRKTASTARKKGRRPAPEIDYKTPVTRRSSDGPDGTYVLTGKGRKYVARKEAQERKPFSASKFFKKEEVQFTEEELAEAFAIFLEENFHVDMLTEEDLYYVFENEFPQWLEEEAPGAANRRADMERKNFIATQAKTSAAAAAQQRAKKADLTRIERENKRGAPAERERLDPRADEDPMYNGSGVAKSVDRIVAKIKSAPKPDVRKTASTARNQVRRPAPEIDYKTPVTTRGPDGTYGLTGKGREYVARKEAQERARTAASDAIVRRTGRGQLSWAKEALKPKD